MSPAMTATPVSWWLKVGLELLLLGAWILGSLSDPARHTPILGTLLILSGGALQVVHYGILKRRSPRLEPPRALVTRGGLFPWVRHPMYLGDLILLLGLGIALTTPWAAGLTAVGMGSVVMLARHEDRRLARRFPEPHRSWSRRAGLLGPRLGG